jgi:aspartate/methionine/tyrosine aminotransferase
VLVVNASFFVKQSLTRWLFFSLDHSAPLQKLALPLMDLDFIRRDTWALQRHFKMKRDFLLTELPKIGITVKWEPTATFYIWADLSDLPPPINDW